MRILCIFVIFLTLESSEGDHQFNATIFDKRLRTLARKMKHQSRNIKEEVLGEVREIVKPENNDKEVFELKQDMAILKQAFNQVNNEMADVKQRLQNVEGEKLDMLRRIETAERDCRQRVKEAKEEVLTNITETNDKVRNVSVNHDVDVVRITSFTSEQHQNVSEELTKLSRKLFSRVNETVIHAVDNVRVDIIHMLQKPVSTSVVLSSQGFDRTNIQKGRDQSIMNTPMEESFLLTLTYNATTGYVLLLFDLRNMSKNMMTGVNFYNAHPSYAYHSVTNNVYWSSFGYPRRIYHSKYKMKAQEQRFISDFQYVIFLILDPYKGILFILTSSSLHSVKTNGYDNNHIKAFPSTTVNNIAIDFGKQIIFIPQLDRISKMSYYGNNEDTVLITPETVQHLVLSTDRETLYFDQGNKIMKFSLTDKRSTFVTEVPYLKWKLLKYYESKLFLSYGDRRMTKYDYLDLKNNTFVNIH